MWISKKQLIALEERIIAQLGIRMEAHKQDFHTKPQLYCETCGCLLQENMAVAGEPIIISAPMGLNSARKVLHYPYFCKKHNAFQVKP